MRLFLQYLKSKRGYMALLALFAGIFAAVFSLYDLPVEAVGYASVLCGVAGLIGVLVGFFRFREVHRVLTGLEENLAGLAGELPAPGTPLEADYRRLTAALYRAYLDEQTGRGGDWRDLVDYYTLWAHQIKTPIAAMDLILQKSDHPDRGELAQQLFKIGQYVDMVLQYLKLESRSTDLALAQQDLDPIVRGVIRKFKGTFIRSGLRLRYDGVEGRALTDGGWLAFAVEQILSNALKYTPEGEIAIYMDETRPDTLVIRDTGVGIRPEDLPRVTEKGFIGLNGRVEGRATGIGLYLARRMLERLGHTLHIESAPGEGTAVYIGLTSLDLGVE